MHFESEYVIPNSVTSFLEISCCKRIDDGSMLSGIKHSSTPTNLAAILDWPFTAGVFSKINAGKNLDGFIGKSVFAIYVSELILVISIRSYYSRWISWLPIWKWHFYWSSSRENLINLCVYSWSSQLVINSGCSIGQFFSKFIIGFDHGLNIS